MGASSDADEAVQRDVVQARGDDDAEIRVMEKADRDNAGVQEDRRAPVDSGLDAVPRPSRNGADTVPPRLSYRSGHPSSMVQRTPHTRSIVRERRVHGLA